MKKTTINNKSILALAMFLSVAAFCLNGCKKFLDAKPDQKLATPSDIEDVQALLDDYTDMNLQLSNAGPRSDDDFYLLDSYIGSRDVNSQNIYTWQKDAIVDDGWNTMYKVVLNANLSLETLQKIQPSAFNKPAYNMAYGSALFFRSFAFYQLLQVYAPPYDSNTAGKDLGIPVRLQSDVSTKNTRNSVSEGYKQIIDDTKESIALLPNRSYPPSRPSRAAAYSLLANVYLSMGNYQEAGLYADSALQIQNTLIDYNNADSTASKPFTRFNDEVIFSAATAGNATLYTSHRIVDSFLFSSYSTNDLRRALFFKKTGANQYGFKGNYQESAFGVLFNGFAVDEMLLIRSESFARENKVSLAMDDLNELLAARYKTGSFVPLTAGNSKDALTVVLEERRKELIGRGNRWNDLRRLNREPAFAKDLKRVVNGVIYELPANDPRYTFYIPQQVVGMAGMKQNQR
ncbi:MAG: RagB/SusD family nutrient uptake outer membrane protein [Ginsengibacter sp.]